MRLALIAAALACLAAPTLAAPPTDLPAAIFSDPPADAANPAKMVVLHIPSGGVAINGVAYLAAGAGPHPTLVLAHGLPGNEKNLDIAQAVRRAGWNVITFNYRGSWGSPGPFGFGQNIEDGAAVLAYLRVPANAAALRTDPRRLVIGGHSMGGWVAINTAAHDPGVIGLISISAADMTRSAGAPREQRVKIMAENMESLAGVTAESMADDVVAAAPGRSFADAAPGLVGTPYLALTSDDGLAAGTDALTDAIKSRGGTRVTAQHVATDHGWNDHRIALEATIIHWLQALPAAP